MKIIHCKLTESIQKKLLAFFILEVKGCSAAYFVIDNPKSVAPFYRKIREIISYHLVLETDEVFDGLN